MQMAFALRVSASEAAANESHCAHTHMKGGQRPYMHVCQGSTIFTNYAGTVRRCLLTT